MGPVAADPEESAPADLPAADSQLVGRWLRLDHTGGAGGAGPARVRLEPAPGATERAILHLVAPDLPGEYLLVLDVVSGSVGSLTAAGGDPVVVRVTVAWPPVAPSAAPQPEASATP